MLVKDLLFAPPPCLASTREEKSFRFAREGDAEKDLERNLSSSSSGDAEMRR